MIEIKEKEIKNYTKNFEYIDEIFTCLIYNLDGSVILPKPKTCVEKIIFEDYFDRKREKEDLQTIIKLDFTECWHHPKEGKVKIEANEKERKIIIKEERIYPIENTSSLEITISPRETNINLEEYQEEDRDIIRRMRIIPRFMLRIWGAVKRGYRIGSCGAPKGVARTKKHILEIVFYPEYNNIALYSELKERNENSCTLHFEKHVNELMKNLKPIEFYIKEVAEEKEEIKIGNFTIKTKKIPLENEY
jgi:hypothetical protein